VSASICRQQGGTLGLKMCKYDGGAELTADLLEAKIGRFCVVSCELLLAANVELQRRHWYDTCYAYGAEFHDTLLKADLDDCFKGTSFRMLSRILKSRTTCQSANTTMLQNPEFQLDLVIRFESSLDLPGWAEAIYERRLFVRDPQLEG
jgi:hypothetical protein